MFHRRHFADRAMSLNRLLAAALVLLSVLACPLEGKDYEQAKFKKAGKGTLEFVHGNDALKLPISLSLKVFDDQGTEFDPIEGTKFLIAGNVLDIKTDTDATTGKESIVEVHFVSGKVAKLGSSKKVDLHPSPDFKGRCEDEIEERKEREGGAGGQQGRGR
jgi:hypothetical protein